MLKQLGLLGLLWGSALGAQAATAAPYSIGVHYFSPKVSYDHGGSERQEGVGIALGYQPFEYFSIETRFNQGLKDASLNDYPLDIHFAGGIYASPQITLWDSATFYGLIGYNYLQGKFGGWDGHASGFSYGGGVRLLNRLLVPAAAFYVEYVNELDLDAADINSPVTTQDLNIQGWRIGFAYHF